MQINFRQDIAQAGIARTACYMLRESGVPVTFDSAKTLAPEGVYPGRFAAQCMHLETKGYPIGYCDEYPDDN